MFPLRDENPRAYPPIATVGIIALNIVVWAIVQGFGNESLLAASICQYGLIPADVLGTVPAGSSFQVSNELTCVLDGSGGYASMVTSMFMHGGWFHIVGNLWFLWIFGDNVEDAMGPGRFLVFYLLCGLGAAAAQMLTDTSSLIPMVGASGAIGGVMGAYALLYPRAHIHTFIFLGFYMTTVAVPALFMLGYWFVLQLIGGLPALNSEGGGVAFWAHIGGFLVGIALVLAFVNPNRLARHRAQAMRPSSRHRWM